MGPPRTRAERADSRNRSRFQEGSMNDRASAVPPVHFLQPEQLEALEKPVLAEVGSRSFGDEDEKPQQSNKRGSKLLGQVWEGVRGRLRLRRDADDGKDKANKKRGEREAKEPRESKESSRDERPTKDEVMANYHQLVASGFFSSHAIQSSRQPGPPGTSRTTSRPSTSHGPQHQAPPQWPLAMMPLTPTATRASSPVCSPASASSRGTKRAAETDAEGEDTEASQLTPKKLRRIASRDIILPKLRSVAARRSTLGRRSMSAVGGGIEGSTQREPNKLTKRGGPPPAIRNVPHDHSERPMTARRNVSDGFHAAFAKPTSSSGANNRVLRSRVSAEPLKVVPDVNRGIPSVPAIPAKFTYGEDRENNGPWRGLRRILTPPTVMMRGSDT